jgi:hypothetical protein
MERLFSKYTEKPFACNSLKLEERASFSSARTTNRFPSPRCASTIQIVESTAETQPKLQPHFLRLSAMIRSTSSDFKLTMNRGV